MISLKLFHAQVIDLPPSALSGFNQRKEMAALNIQARFNNQIKKVLLPVKVEKKINIYLYGNKMSMIIITRSLFLTRGCALFLKWI